MSGTVDRFLSNPHFYEFFQAIRVLSRRNERREFEEGDERALRDSRFETVSEPVRIGAHSSFSFPASDIQSVTASRDGSLDMRVNMIGLTGVAGPLPHYYTAMILQANAERDTALEDFLNIFNHRLAYLFYYAWEKSRFPAAYDRTGLDPFRNILLALAGVPVHLPPPGGLAENFFARYAPLLAMQPRSGEALRSLLGSFFGVELEIQQFAGAWYPLSARSLTAIEDDDSVSGRLGWGSVAGSEHWSLDSMVRIRIGPLGRTAFARFLPGGQWNAGLREICRFFSRGEVEFEVQLVLNRLVVPRCELGDNKGLQLGWTTWMKSRPAREHQDGVVFRL